MFATDIVSDGGISSIVKKQFSHFLQSLQKFIFLSKGKFKTSVVTCGMQRCPAILISMCMCKEERRGGGTRDGENRERERWREGGNK